MPRPAGRTYLSNPHAALACFCLLAAGCARPPKFAAAIPAVKQPPRVQYTMRIIDLAPGAGKPAEAGKVFVVHYTGWLRDGTKFDSSVDRGKPLEFEQGKRRVIPGWDAGFEGMRVGARRRLIIPYQLAYGEKGRPPRIPPKSELIFDVELLDVKDPPPAAEPAKP